VAVGGGLVAGTDRVVSPQMKGKSAFLAEHSSWGFWLKPQACRSLRIAMVICKVIHTENVKSQDRSGKLVLTIQEENIAAYKVG
jgi:hypothetical protein